MEKIFKQKEVFDKHSQNEILWKDVKDFKFEDGDLILAGYAPPEYIENYGHDGYYYFSVEREVLETDEEFEKRKRDTEREKERQKKNRYENYLRLKREFENESSTSS
jgi:inorganic pyrophosphatase/exopolyphosphatase